MELQVCYRYDGSFAGFLTCVYESCRCKEVPVGFYPPEDPRISLYPEREIETCLPQAQRVFAGLGARISPQARLLVTHGFLTCLPDREMALYNFIRYGFEVGAQVTDNLTDNRVAVLTNAVIHLKREAELLRGFTRFSDYNGTLAGEIAPKNWVLPLLKGHFCARFPQETFVLYDRTHRQALLHRPGSAAILPADSFRLDSPDEVETSYRLLWRRFYDTIAIEGRYNPKLRRTHMPKRYWDTMTEFRED